MKVDVFEKDPIPKAVSKLAIPTILGMIVTIVYNLADTFFVGQLKDPYQIAGVTITMPVFIILLSLGYIFGVGGSSFISRLLGNKDFEMAKRTSSFAFYACLALGLVCIGVGVLLINPLLTLCGSSPETHQYAWDYLIVILLGSPAIMLSFSMGQVIRAEGASKEAMIGMMIGTVVNIGLDPLLIFTCNMGVTGAAIATVFSNLLSVLYYMWYFIRKSKNLTISPKYLKIDKIMLKNVFTIGLPASLNEMLFSASNIILNRFAVGYGDDVIAAIGVVFKVNMFPVLILMGLCQGVQPLIGYNYASGDQKRLKGIMKFTGISAVIIGSVFTVLLFFLGHFAVEAFAPGQETVIRYGTQFLNAVMISVPVIGLVFLFTSAFQSMGKGIPSMVLSLSRQGFIFIPTIIIANAVIGLNGIVYAQPIADLVSTILAIVMFTIIWKRDRKKREKQEVQAAPPMDEDNTLSGIHE